MDIAQKTVKVAENVPASCAVVRNALATAQGERIEVNDVSPIEHEMKVQLESPDITDFSEVQVTRYGRNLLNGADLVPHINANGQPLESVVFNGRQCLKTIVGKENMIDSYGRYTFDVPLTYFSAEVYSQSRTAAVFTMYKKSGKILYAAPSRDLSNWRIDAEATDDDPFVSVSMYVYGKNDSETVYIDTNGFYGSIVADNQEKTPYVQPQTYTPGEDGTVRGIKSLSPTTILTTDTAGASIKCKYFPTGQERVAQIHQAITDELEHLKSITAMG